MKQFISLLLVCFLAGSAYSNENSTGSSEIVFSEMTVDSPPGDDGSWVELYNRSNSNVKLDGYTIVCNAQNIFTFPALNIIAKPKEIILIRFEKNVEELKLNRHDLSSIKTGISSRKVKYDPHNIIRKGLIGQQHPIVKQRSPGYCALFSSTNIISENLIDYVSWGRSKFLKGVVDTDVNRWAISNELWRSGDGISVGIDPLFGESFFPEYIAIQRLGGFIPCHDSTKYWRAVFLTAATPGKGNFWPPLTAPFLVDGSLLHIEDRLRVSVFSYGYYEPFFHFMKGEDIKIRLQIAKDPHFEEIIYNKLIPPTATIEDYDFKVGTYFARVRIDTDKVSTDWSPVSSFRYVEREKNEND